MYIYLYIYIYIYGVYYHMNIHGENVGHSEKAHISMSPEGDGFFEEKGVGGGDCKPPGLSSLKGNVRSLYTYISSSKNKQNPKNHLL